MRIDEFDNLKTKDSPIIESKVRIRLKNGDCPLFIGDVQLLGPTELLCHIKVGKLITFSFCINELISIDWGELNNSKVK